MNGFQRNDLVFCLDILKIFGEAGNQISIVFLLRCIRDYLTHDWVGKGPWKEEGRVSFNSLKTPSRLVLCSLCCSLSYVLIVTNSIYVVLSIFWQQDTNWSPFVGENLIWRIAPISWTGDSRSIGHFLDWDWCLRSQPQGEVPSLSCKIKQMIQMWDQASKQHSPIVPASAPVWVSAQMSLSDRLWSECISQKQINKNTTSFLPQMLFIILSITAIKRKPEQTPTSS